MSRIGIIGAGPTGLGVAWRLRELGHGEHFGFEAAASPGGLAATLRDPAGFLWDLGGHVQFSHYGYYDAVLDDVVPEWLWHERVSAVWYRNRFVPYPFQLNLHRLPPEDRDAALVGLRRAAAEAASGQASRPRDFREWMSATCGDELARIFMVPYNLKVWGTRPNAMSWNWIGERVAPPDLNRIEANLASGKDDVGWGPNSRFRFPARGGTGAIWEAVHAHLGPSPFRFSSGVGSVDASRRTLEDGTGREWPFDALVSTIPLDQLVARTRGLPERTRRAASRLRHTSTHVVGIGLEGPQVPALRRMCWMYFPEASSAYYRVTVFSNYSPHHVPDGSGHWSLMAEVCESDLRPVDARSIVAEVEESMRQDQLIPSKSNVVSRWHKRLEYGYPTPTVERDEILHDVLPALETRGILSRGRFGAWKYEVSNQDHAFMQGVEAADRLVNGTVEVTISDPARVNRGEFLHARLWPVGPSSATSLTSP